MLLKNYCGAGLGRCRSLGELNAATPRPAPSLACAYHPGLFATFFDSQLKINFPAAGFRVVKTGEPEIREPA